ncbi:MAG TPA: hypothetical protein VF945_21705 [Polyangia bacterium]
MSGPRRSLLRSLPPLWLIGVCLFLPTVRACSKLESPAQLLWGSKPLFVAMLSPYLVAQLLVIVGVVALARGRVGPLLLRAATALAALAGASAAVLAILGFDGRDLAAQLWRVFAGVCLAGGALVLVRARRLEPWTRLDRCYAAYTIFTLPLGALAARIVVGDGPLRVGVGAWGFLAAVAALVVVHARALRAARDPLRVL